jgi:integrase
MSLSDLHIKSLKAPNSGQKFYPDETIPGFGIRVSQGGSKSFVLNYGIPKKRFTIGRYPVITLSEARGEARKKLAAHTLGQDVLESISFDAAKERYLAACKKKNRPRTVQEYEWLLRNFQYGRTPLNLITRRDVSISLDKLRDRPGTENHALMAVKVFLTWCVSEGYLETNPAIYLKQRSPSQARERILNDRELAKVWHMAVATPYPYGRIVQLLILTGQRRSEIASLRWDWIDTKAQMITWPGTFTKNKRSHILPYGNMAKAIIDELPHIDDSPYVFPAARSHVNGVETTIFNGWAKSKREFSKSFPGIDHFTLHDLRRTFSSKMAQIGTPLHVTEKLLNHVSGSFSGVAGVYNRYTYAPEMRAAIDRYEESLMELFSQKPE